VAGIVQFEGSALGKETGVWGGGEMAGSYGKQGRCES